MRRIAKHSGAAVRAFHVKAFSCGGTAAPQLVSAQQLLQHVQDKIWHSSNSQLHAAKQALATHLVRSANLDLLEAEPDASSSVDLDPSRYQIPGPRAGALLLKAIDARRGATPVPWKNLKDLLQDDPYFSVIAVHPHQANIQLNIAALIHDISAADGSSSIDSTADQLQGSASTQESAATVEGQAYGIDHQPQQLAAAEQIAQSRAPSASMSVAQLMQYVASRRWHASNGLFDVSKRAIVQHLVVQANAKHHASDIDTSLDMDASKYEMPSTIAGYAIKAAFEVAQRAENASGTAKAPKLSQLVEGDPMFSFCSSASNQLCLQLDLAALVQEASCSRDVSPSQDLQALSQQQPLQLPQIASMPVRKIPLMPLLASLQLLSSVTAAQCAAAEVIVITEKQLASDNTQQASQLAGLLAHLQAAGIAALDCEFTFKTTKPPASSPHDGGSIAGSANSHQVNTGAVCQDAVGRSPRTYNTYQAHFRLSGVELALMQLFVPAVCGSDRPATTAEAAAPAGASAAGSALMEGADRDTKSWPSTVYVIEVPEKATASSQLSQLLRPILESDSFIKVVQDARFDGCVLQQQLAITLRGVLDTQLLAGLAALADSSTATSARSSNAFRANLARVPLHELYQAYGYAHAATNRLKGPSCWHKRPLSSAQLRYAANDVRFLLPLARDLLQLIPAAAIALGDLQLQLAQQGAAALQLTPQLLAGYYPLLVPRSTAAGTRSGPWCSQQAIPAYAFAVPDQEQLTSLLFELEMQQGTPGWYTPRYTLYLDEAAAGEVDASRTVSPMAAQISDSLLSGLECLFPTAVLEHMRPYVSPQEVGQSCVVQVIADAGSNLMLRWSDGSIVELPCSLNIPDALQLLTAAVHRSESQPQPSQQHNSKQPHSNISSISQACSCHTAANASLDSSRPAAWKQLWHATGANSSSSSSQLSVPGTLHKVAPFTDSSGNILGLTYHVGSEAPGSALLLADVLSSMKAGLRGQGHTYHCSQADKSSTPSSLIILGRLGSGKTALLRDVARLMSNPECIGGLGMTVLCLDTHGDLAVGPGRCTGLGRARVAQLEAGAQATAINEALQQHRPDAILVHQVSDTEQEVVALNAAIEAGVLVIAGVECSSFWSLSSRPQLAAWLQLGGRSGTTAVVELQGINRLRLHLDGQASYHQITASTSTQQYEHAAALDSQLRFRNSAAGNRLAVRFATAEAAQLALDLGTAISLATSRVAAPSSCEGLSSDSNLTGASGSTSPQHNLSHEAQEQACTAFAGGWLVDLMHAAVHKCIQAGVQRH